MILVDAADLVDRLESAAAEYGQHGRTRVDASEVVDRFLDLREIAIRIRDALEDAEGLAAS